MQVVKKWGRYILGQTSLGQLSYTKGNNIVNFLMVLIIIKDYIGNIDIHL